MFFNSSFEGVIWKPHRKLINPTFNLAILEQYVETFEKNTKILMEILSKKLNTTFDVYNYINNCTLDIISGII